MAKRIHLHIHDSAYTYNGTYDPKDAKKWKGVWRFFNKDGAPVPLDEDLERIAWGKPANIVADIYELQMQRDRTRAKRFSSKSIFEDSHSCGCKK